MAEGIIYSSNRCPCGIRAKQLLDAKEVSDREINWMKSRNLPSRLFPEAAAEGRSLRFSLIIGILGVMMIWPVWRRRKDSIDCWGCDRSDNNPILHSTMIPGRQKGASETVRIGVEKPATQPTPVVFECKIKSDEQGGGGGMTGKTIRKTTRSLVWPDTVATVKVEDTLGNPHSKNKITFTGPVKDLGSAGMFLRTTEAVPVPAKAEIVIDFDFKAGGSKLTIAARGETVRKTPEGVGIKFSRIDLRQLQKCIIAKINRMKTPGTETPGG